MTSPHPSPVAIRKAMDRLAPFVAPDNRVSMSQANIIRRTRISGCETFACHGGWYALATMGERFQWRRMYERRERAHIGPWPVEFDLGADELAMDLGFNDRHQLAGWAFYNPDICGNVQGGNMFCAGPSGREAFGVLSADEITFGLDVVVAWWRAVADRIEALEKVT